jgi:hypothetical protein
MRKLKSVLGREVKDQFDNRWEYELYERSQHFDLPDEIKQYQEMLHKAIFFHNRATGRKVVGRKPKVYSRNWYVHRPNHKHLLAKISDGLFVAAADFLANLLEQDADRLNPKFAYQRYENCEDYQRFFDRKIEYVDGHFDIVPDFESMPRLVTSRSTENRRSASQSYTKKDTIKRELLSQALEEIEIDELGLNIDEISWNYYKNVCAHSAINLIN